jgi:hypothetical protein
MAFDVINGQREISVRCGDLHNSLALGHSDCDITDTIGMLQVELQYYHEEMTSLSRTTARAEQLVVFLVQVLTFTNLQRYLPFWQYERATSYKPLRTLRK